MPIASTDIDFHLSGGAANSDVDASLGGAISSTQITDATLNNLFDDVSSDESSAGDTEYRCIYVKNNHGSLTLQNAVIWIDTDTPSTDSDVDIGLGTSAINGTEQSVADEDTAPAGVTFSSPASKATGLSIGNIPAGQHKAVWLERVISPGAAAFNSDSVILKVAGDTAA